MARQQISLNFSTSARSGCEPTNRDFLVRINLGDEKISKIVAT